MASGLLRQEQDSGNNESCQNAGGSVAAERKAALVNRLVEQITQGGAERSREDKSAPEEHSARDARKEIPRSYQRQPCRRQDIESTKR
jgi:hypothetical protein